MCRQGHIIVDMFAEVNGAASSMSRIPPSLRPDASKESATRLSARRAPDSPDAHSMAVTEPDAIVHAVRECSSQPSPTAPAAHSESRSDDTAGCAIASASTTMSSGEQIIGAPVAAESPHLAARDGADPKTRVWPPVTDLYAALRAAAVPSSRSGAERAPLSGRLAAPALGVSVLGKCGHAAPATSTPAGAARRSSPRSAAGTRKGPDPLTAGSGHGVRLADTVGSDDAEASRPSRPGVAPHPARRSLAFAHATATGVASTGHSAAEMVYGCKERGGGDGAALSGGDGLGWTWATRWVSCRRFDAGPRTQGAGSAAVSRHGQPTLATCTAPGQARISRAASLGRGRGPGVLGCLRPRWLGVRACTSQARQTVCARLPSLPVYTGICTVWCASLQRPSSKRIAVPRRGGRISSVATVISSVATRRCQHDRRGGRISSVKPWAHGVVHGGNGGQDLAAATAASCSPAVSDASQSDSPSFSSPCRVTSPPCRRCGSPGLLQQEAPPTGTRGAPQRH